MRIHKGTLGVVAIGVAALFGFNVASYCLSASIPLPTEDYLGIGEVNRHGFVSHCDGVGAKVCCRPAIRKIEVAMATPFADLQVPPAMRTEFLE
jgi:hypothetical protein